MGTITSSKRKDNSVAYTAQIRVHRDGKTVYQESQTFERKQIAQAWIKRRETELSASGAIDRANRKGATVKEMIDRYLDEYGVLRPLDKTKRATLKATSETWIGEILDSALTSQHLVEYGQWRMSVAGRGVKAQTVGNDLSHLGAVLSVARPAWGYLVDPHAMPDARKVLRKLGANMKSEERSRRHTLDELDKIMGHYVEMQARRSALIHMPKVTAFAIFSTRWQEEITRIRWDDLDEHRQAVLVRDMKNPSQKIGNDVWCYLPDEAWGIVNTMPMVAKEVSPYNAKSISASFTRACQFLEIEDLHFHDLRHDGVSRLFEIDWDIPRVASVSGHRDWNSLRRYTHLRGRGDRYKKWSWSHKLATGLIPHEL
ncbi:tyrosine-type recombinase/integrase [Pseudomonas syringae]|nr:tyrosine-type recombinase/integrase [Pseudomonas syringae]